MKTYFIPQFLILSVFCLTAQAVDFEVRALQLEIGPDGSNQVGNSGWPMSGAIGQNNNVWGNFSLAVGESNGVGGRALAVGSFNSLEWGGAAFGTANDSAGYDNVLVGAYNWAQTSSEEGGSYTSLLAGEFNVIGYNVSSSFVAGMNNYVSTSYPGAVMASATLGMGLYNPWTAAT